MPRLFGVVAVAAALIALSFSGTARAGIFDSDQGNTPPALAKKLNQPVADELIATLEKASKAGLGLGVKPSDAALQMISG
ncbi:MAG: hypothetical protein L0I62_10200, partial [Gammaproteobacteria bacterium]|nr:hypothetical protein [Gammaproteobacteria bacterium]